MALLYSAAVPTDFGDKQLEIHCCDILDFGEDIDILTTSAAVGSYAPTPRTMFAALRNVGICVRELAQEPDFDLRNRCNVWLSHALAEPIQGIRRIGCVELMRLSLLGCDLAEIERAIIDSIRAYFAMLQIASIYDVKMETVAMPLLGAGNQHIAMDMMIVPLFNECIHFLKHNPEVKRICFIERNPAKANFIAQYAKTSYHLQGGSRRPAPVTPEKRAQAFISYATEDKNIADNLCAKLEQAGVKVWYAPRDVRGPYASAIAEAIDASTHFVVILSENSIASQHVLNEIDLAFQNLPSKIKFKPLRIDETMFTPSFRYYLSRQHYMDAVNPPLEDRLSEFVAGLLQDL